MNRRLLLTSLTSLAAFACGGRVELQDPVDQPGRHHVGYREAEFKYTPLGDSERTLRLAVWYPTDSTEGGETKYLGVARPGVLSGAKPAGSNLPVLVFSHGRLAFAEASGFVGEYFASHGFVAIAPDHTGDTTVNLVDPLTTETFARRPQDLGAALDYLYNLPSNDSLAGKIGQEVIAVGHSFGGYTVFAAAGASFPLDPASCSASMGPHDWCSTMTPALGERFKAGFLDSRIWSLAAMAPGSADVLGPQGLGAITIPEMLFTGGLDSVDGARWFGPMSAGALWVQLPKASHNSFTDVCELFPGVGGNDVCSPMALPAATLHPTMSTYLLAFARRSLFGDGAMSAILAGTSSVSPNASIQTHL
ncbi:MAG: hypothetical protein U1E65_10810 [Myxococcota bacterium]